MNRPLIAVVVLAPLVMALVDLMIGYPDLPWHQRLPHNLLEAASGAFLWHYRTRRSAS